VTCPGLRSLCRSRTSSPSSRAGGGRYAGVAPSGTALSAGQVTALETAAGPLTERGVIVAFDADPAGREATLRSHGLLRAAGAPAERSGTATPPCQPRSVGQHR